MWLLDNLTPFAAERTWVRDETGAEIWLVVVKGSYVIGQGEVPTLDTTQAPVSRVPAFEGAPSESHLLHECDLVHKKLRTDVILNASAYAPRGRPTKRVDVRMTIGTIQKTLRVHGDRRIRCGTFGLELSPADEFITMPINYRRAFGGTDLSASDPKRHGWEPSNPVGTGYGMTKERVDGTVAPNIEYPESPYRSWSKGVAAGFGAIARHWTPRVNYRGTYDRHWEETRKPLLPLDFSAEFYQCAPPDQQQRDFLRGGELLELENLSPEGYLRCRLPRVTLGLTTLFYDGSKALHRADLHTLLVDPDQRKLQLVWHSQLPCHHKVNKLRVTTVLAKTDLHGFSNPAHSHQ